jgi:hypothetical protein
VSSRYYIQLVQTGVWREVGKVVTASGDVVVVCVVCIVERLVPEYLIRASRERAGVRQWAMQ